ncbi:MAG TPA: hypothetical protein DEQ77_00920 [Candidatus Omnitrophica bacterium]|nr:hypothetical protein [Candidatus Omnitrophota bacterium]
MKRDDSFYLKHILNAILKIEKYTKEISQADFKRSDLIQDGQVRQIEIIGEATKHLSAEFRSKNAAIPWKDIAGMRDKLIHEYFGVDLEILWRVVRKDIPTVKRAIRQLSSEID